ncbi:unnamed protein product [Peronospora farinosa]|uniref:FYVE-type domain-containing protein n=1 Tax=Peronospora farinosa TaxID=134698 RepID=A0AAV0T2F5_9STRA|nr:unnamed protein product [Peronospora farinosa]CAI5713399.1 unnamed protein product [Peronospora farinosa]
MYGIAAPDCASMALNNASLYHDAVDGDVLAAIELPTQRSPFRFLGIKWLVKSATGSSAKYRIASPIDLVYLEATGIITRGDGVRIGYQIVHSVKLRGCPELNDSHGVIRARCDSVYLFIELNNKTVDVFIKSNVMPNERISESASLQSCAESLLHCGRTVESSQNKKLVWQLECSGNLRRKHKQEQKVKATHCSVCNKTFGRFLRHSFECKLCLSAMCSKCCVESTLKSVDVSSDNRHTNKTVLTIVVELCTSCVAANLRASALTLAREEVTSGRFGRASSTSLLSSGQHRGSNNSADGSSVATIAIEDIPSQREHHTRPPRRSDESVRKGHHLQARESRRSHRDQGSSRDDPEPGKCGREHQSQNVHVDVSETLSRKGHAHRDSPSSQPAKHLDSCKSRVRSGSDEPTNPDVRVHPPTFRRGRSGEMRRYVPRTEDTGRSKCDIDHFPLPKSILNGYHHSGDADIPLKLDHLGRGDRGMPVTLCDLDSVSPYKMSKESIRKTASSSGSSLASINTASLNTREPEAEDDAIEFRDTFDSFGDLLDIHDDLDDVYETLDTKDMAAVKRSSQVHSQLWQQIAELRDAAENVYQYTKESTEMHITQGGSVRFPECAPASK